MRKLPGLLREFGKIFKKNPTQSTTGRQATGAGPTKEKTKSRFPGGYKAWPMAKKLANGAFACLCGRPDSEHANPEMPCVMDAYAIHAGSIEVMVQAGAPDEIANAAFNANKGKPKPPYPVNMYSVCKVCGLELQHHKNFVLCDDERECTVCNKPVKEHKDGKFCLRPKKKGGKGRK